MFNIEEELRKPVDASLFGVRTLGDWAGLLKGKRRHWKPGHSARALALCWSEAKGVPSDVEAMLGLGALRLLEARPEHRVAVGGSGGDSCTDIMALVESYDGKTRAFLAVEGKGRSDHFGLPCRCWLVAGLSPRSQRNRSRRLQECLALLPEDIGSIDDVPYQLVHRAASAMSTAAGRGVRSAYLVVHAFESKLVEWHFEGFAKFTRAFGAEALRNGVVTLGQRNGAALGAAWVDGSPDYLI